MTRISSVFAEAAASDDGRVDPIFYVVLVAGLALVAVAMKAIFARRAKAKVAGAAGAAAGGVAIRIAPAPPFPDDVARVRALLGETSPVPQITRYTVPVVTADARSLQIRDAKIGEIVSIPLSAISSIEAREATIKPKGTLVARVYPSLWITLTGAAGQLAIALTPLVGAYDKVRQSDADAMASELSALLATTPR